MIGGKVVDASALAALIRGRLSAVAWFATAEAAGLVLYLPTLALAEVRAVRPDAGEELAEVMGHSMIVLGELDAANYEGEREKLGEAGTSRDPGDHRSGHWRAAGSLWVTWPPGPRQGWGHG